MPNAPRWAPENPMVELRENPDATPICPHCSEPAEEIWYRQLKSFLGQRYVYFCGRCRKILGVSHRKGFWMG
jgi:hypothetical protein